MMSHFKGFIPTEPAFHCPNVRKHQPAPPECHPRCRGEGSELSARFLAFSTTPLILRKCLAGKRKDEEHVVAFFIESIYCNLESSATVESLIR